jgi:phosphohistidine phosphatase
MTDLYILRHGIAVAAGTPGIPDNERRLTPKGQKRMRQIARGLCVLKLGLERIVTSPLPRARETAEIVADALDAPDLVEVSNVLLAGTAATTIEDWLRHRTEDRLMIVGHNPTLSDLISLLVLGATQPPLCDLKKGGIAALKRSAGARDQFEVAWIAPPRLLRNLSGADLGSDQ